MDSPGAGADPRGDEAGPALLGSLSWWTTNVQGAGRGSDKKPGEGNRAGIQSLPENNADARRWLGDDITDQPQLTAFQWHGETFSLPEGATRILTGTACSNQAFVIGKSLGMQCHTEMTPEMIEAWCIDWAQENADPSLPSVQTPEEMRGQLNENLRALRQLSDRLYSSWIKGLRS